MNKRTFTTASEMMAGLYVPGLLKLWIEGESVLWPEFGGWTSYYEVSVFDCIEDV